MTKNSIYAYLDPRPEKLNQIRYIGADSQNGLRAKNFAAHKHGHLKSLLISCKRLNLVPDIFILEEYSDEIGFKELGDEEEWYIAYYRSLGADLVNLSSGGVGLKNPTAEVRAGMSMGISKAAKGKRKSTESIAKREATRNLVN